MLAALGLTVARQIPLQAVPGLLTGMYSVYGGVIRNAAGQIVSHLVTSGAPLSLASLIPSAGVLAGGLLQEAQLWKIGKDVAAVQQTVNTALDVAMATTALSGLGLVTSIAGFAYLSHRLSQLDEKLTEVAKDVKEIKLSQESLHRSELQTAIDSARHAEAANDPTVRKGLLIDSKREFNKLTHHYRQQWDRCQSVPDILAVNELYTLAILGCAMASSDLGLREDAALDLKSNCHEWTVLARRHASTILLGAHPERLLSGDYVEQLPAGALVQLMDFARDDKRGIEWIDVLRSESSKHTSLLGTLTSSAPDALKKRLSKAEPSGAIALAKSLHARANVLDANVAHYEFLRDKQISASEFQLQLDDARRSSGAEAICVYPASAAA